MDRRLLSISFYFDMSHSCQSDRKEQTVAWLADKGRDNDGDKNIKYNTVFVSSDGNIEKDTKWDFQFTPKAKANNTSIDQLIASHIPFVALIISSQNGGLPHLTPLI